MKGKRGGSFSLGRIVAIILAVAAFAVVVVAVANSDLFSKSGENPATMEICRSSVILRGTLWSKTPTELFGLDQQAPLNCDTFNVCIYVNEKNCPSLMDRKGIIYVKVKNKDEALKAIADKLADAHWMFGEGGYRWTLKEGDGYYCFISHRIAFSDELTGETLSKTNLLSFMKINAPFNGESKWETYNDYFYEEGASAYYYIDWVYPRYNGEDKHHYLDYVLPYDNLDLSKIYIVAVPQKIGYKETYAYVYTSFPKLIIDGKDDPYLSKDNQDDWLGCVEYFGG